MASGGTLSQEGVAYQKFLEDRLNGTERAYVQAMNDWGEMTQSERLGFHPGVARERAAAEAEKRNAELQRQQGQGQRSQGATQSVRTVRMDLNIGGKSAGIDVLEGQESTIESLFRELESQAANSQ
jgi:hypothetical protein